MPEYTVGVREVWVRSLRIEAVDAHEAVRKAQEGENDAEIDFDYSHRLPTIHWSVEDNRGKMVL
jgi:hypothetical protein